MPGSDTNVPSLVRQELFQEFAGYQLFPDVPPNHPFNLCNPNAINGVDCGLALNELYDNPGYRAQFYDTYGAYPVNYHLYVPAISPSWTEPIVSVQDDRVNLESAQHVRIPQSDSIQPRQGFRVDPN